LSVSTLLRPVTLTRILGNEHYNLEDGG
jgi:hypothetical protein